MTKIKKIIIFFLIVLILVIGSKFSKIKKYFLEERYNQVLSKLNISGKCFNPNVDIIDVMKLNGISYKSQDFTAINNSLAMLKSTLPSGEAKIPLITHHVYFTYDKNPIKLHDFYIEKIKANFKRLNETNPNWQHFLWTDNPDIFPSDITSIKGVKIQSLDVFMNHELYPYLKASIKKGNSLRAYFMLASDTLRLMVVQKFGGIYNDIDYEIYNAPELLGLMKKFDFIAGRELTADLSYYGNAFIAAKPNHPIINEAVSKMIIYNTDPNSIPIYMTNACNLLEKLYFTSPPLLTISFFKKNNIEGNTDVVLPSWMIYNVNFAREKNGGCSYTGFSREKFEAEEKDINLIINNYIKNYKNNTRSDYLDVYHNPILFKQDFPIIGADMFCASWYVNRK